MSLRQAAQQALEVLEEVADEVFVDDAITALRAAIEQAKEPVAWISHSQNLLSWDKFYDDMTPLYTAPRFFGITRSVGASNFKARCRHHGSLYTEKKT